MKIIEIDEELYQYIASQTQSIGESASDILRRLLDFPNLNMTYTPKLNTSYNFQSQDMVDETNSKKEEKMIKKQVEQLTSEVLEDKVSHSPMKKQSVESINHLVTKVRAVISSESFLQETKAVVRFLEILKVLYRTNPESFSVATESMQGRTRVYFARDEASLLMSGNHTKPKQIPDTPYWVITNTNSARKMLMLENAMQSMQLPAELIEEIRPFFVAN